jgi:hypothetical protein
MLQRWILMIILAMTIVASLQIGRARAEAVSVTLGQDSISVNMNLLLRENLTALPSINSNIGPENSTSVTQSFLQPIGNAIQKLVPSAKLSNFEVHIKTANITGQWNLEENYSITVTGANVNSGSNIRSDLDFLSMNVSLPLQIAGAEVNGVGPDLLLPALQAKVAAIPNLQFYIDGSQTRNSVIPAQTTKGFWLLDFTWIQPVSTWNSTDNILGQSTSWTLNPPNPRYNLTLGIPSPEGPLLSKYVVDYSPSMSVTVPANAWVNGNDIYFDIPNASEILMPALILATLVIVLASFFIDRKLTGSIRTRSRKR